MAKVIRIVESKEDRERFLNWAGSELADKFYKNIKRLKSPENDIYYWMANSKQELANRLKSLETTKTRRQKQNIAKSAAEHIYEDDTWLVLKINTYDAAVKYGKNTKWCISGINTTDGSYMFDFYKERGATGYYFFINKKINKKYCLVKYASGDDIIWNELDQKIPDIPDAPSIPEVYSSDTDNKILSKTANEILYLYIQYLVDFLINHSDIDTLLLLDSEESFDNFYKVLEYTFNTKVVNKSMLINHIADALESFDEFKTGDNIVKNLNNYDINLLLDTMYNLYIKELEQRL